MSKLSKQARKREFTPKARQEIFCRDRGQCIFCAMEYHMEDITWPGRDMMSVMHFVPRSQNGLGIPQNGAMGCQCHHEMLDNGNKGRRTEMLELFEKYLRRCYRDWNREALIYSKWK